MRMISGLFLLTAALFLTGCFYKPYIRDDNWVYFEEWDLDHNSAIDSVEFSNGYIKSDFFKKWSSRSDNITYDEFSRRVATWKGHENDQAEAYDLNKDGKISDREMAQTIFTASDDNHNNSLGSLEFYQWEIDR